MTWAASRTPAATLGGGIVATGNYPGKARTPDELRADVEKALSLIPGKHRFNLHAFYGEIGGKKVDRNEIEPRPFQELDRLGQVHRHRPGFQPDLLLASQGGRRLHAVAPGQGHPPVLDRALASRCREIGAAIGKALGTPCVTNVWIPDGMKDTPADRRGPRERLAESLDAVFKKKLDPKHNLDAVEGKLFGIGAESYTVGLARVLPRLRRQATRSCSRLDAGHYHPTESIADKISSVLLLRAGDPAARQPRRALGQRPRGHADRRAAGHRAGDWCAAVTSAACTSAWIIFDASINRVAAWVIGTRNMLQALLHRAARPDRATQDSSKRAGDYTSRLALMEEAKTLPFGAVWDYYCLKQGVPVGEAWLAEVKTLREEGFEQASVRPHSNLSHEPTTKPIRPRFP